jgi:hypothetical protein
MVHNEYVKQAQKSDLKELHSSYMVSFRVQVVKFPQRLDLDWKPTRKNIL